MQEWVPKLINAIWDHTACLWHFRNDAAHIRDTKQVAQFKIDSLEREKEQIKNKHKGLRHKLHEFQLRHLERLADIEQLYYNGRKCCAELAKLYLDELENRTIPIESTIRLYFHGRKGVR
jgi:hypothetical protein